MRPPKNPIIEYNPELRHATVNTNWRLKAQEFLEELRVANQMTNFESVAFYEAMVSVQKLVNTIKGRRK